MPQIGPLEIAVVLVIALLIFGPKRLPELGKSLGRGLSEFRQGMQNLGADDDEEAPDMEPPEDLEEDDEPAALGSGEAAAATTPPPTEADLPGEDPEVTEVTNGKD